MREVKTTCMIINTRGILCPALQDLDTGAEVIFEIKHHVCNLFEHIMHISKLLNGLRADFP